MKKSPEQLKAQFARSPSSEKVYEIDGTKYSVTRYFTEQKDLDRVIFELAVSRANRETGLR